MIEEKNFTNFTYKRRNQFNEILESDSLKEKVEGAGRLCIPSQINEDLTDKIHNRILAVVFYRKEQIPLLMKKITIYPAENVNGPFLSFSLNVLSTH